MYIDVPELVEDIRAYRAQKISLGEMLMHPAICIPALIGVMIPFMVPSDLLLVAYLNLMFALGVLAGISVGCLIILLASIKLARQWSGRHCHS